MIVVLGFEDSRQDSRLVDIVTLQFELVFVQCKIDLFLVFNGAIIVELCVVPGIGGIVIIWIHGANMILITAQDANIARSPVA